MEQMVQYFEAVEPVVLALIAGLGGLCLALLIALVVTARRGRAEAETRRDLAQIGQGQQQLVGALTQMAEAQATAQMRAMEGMERRLEEVTSKVSTSLTGSATQTARSLGELQTRLAVIDKAQTRIEKLSGDVLGLQDILSNKQARGAFGEIQLAEIVRQALPPDAFDFQVTLSTGRRADCLIRLPDPPGPIVIDSKFPLESYEALITAETDRAKLEARRAFKAALQTHITAIAERYIVEGETADSALMFLPSEAIYAELHANHGDVVRAGFEKRVWVVSPSTTMALLHTVRGVLRDARIAAESGRIRRELGMMGRDVGRLMERVGNLERHMGQAEKDLREIRISAERTATRAARLEEVEFGDEDGDQGPPLRAIE